MDAKETATLKTAKAKLEELIAQFGNRDEETIRFLRESLEQITKAINAKSPAARQLWMDRAGRNLMQAKSRTAYLRTMAGVQ